MKINGKTAGEIFDSIRSLVHARELTPGMLLPSVRELANELGVNRNTVALAYKRLTDAGFALSQGRNGTIIRDAVSDVELEGSTAGLTLKDLASGNPSPDVLPKLQDLVTFIRSSPSLYGEATIRPELEEAGREWLQADLSTRFELNLTSGAVDAVERVLATWLIAGDRVAVEDPCFLSSISTLKHNRLQVCPVPVDTEGMQPEALACQLETGVKAVIITPRAHNPTGYGLSSGRAAQIRTLLESYPQVLVIVDDHFSLLSTQDYHHVIPLNTQNWVLIRSTSKFLGPDFRLAFVASDGETSARLRQRLNTGTNWVSHILQDLAGASITSPQFRQTIEQARQRYQQQREGLVTALKRYGVTISSQHDGLNIWVPLVGDTSAIVMQLAQRGWLVRGGDSFALGGSSSGLRITVSDLNPTETEQIAQSLAAILSASRQTFIPQLA